MTDDRGVGQRKEGLLATERALRFRAFCTWACAAFPFVCAGGGIADAAIFPAEAVRVDVRSSPEERAKERNFLLGRALGGDESGFLRGLLEIARGFKPDGLFDVSLVACFVAISGATANRNGLALGSRDRLDLLDECVQLAAEEGVFRERLLHGLFLASLGLRGLLPRFAKGSTEACGCVRKRGRPSGWRAAPVLRLRETELEFAEGRLLDWETAFGLGGVSRLLSQHHRQQVQHGH